MKAFRILMLVSCSMILAGCGLGCAVQSPSAIATTQPTTKPADPFGSFISSVTAPNPTAVQQRYQDLSQLYDQATLAVGLIEPFLPAKDQVVVNIAMTVWGNAMQQYAADAASGSMSLLQADLTSAEAGFLGYRQATVKTVTPAIAVKASAPAVAASPPK